mmetsp:Transcript_16667/g.31257  ORF Transcript_16667/g.31257 Transcript_16667/m.31257 type:complete len:244 (+) Transcript_16667:659-1390(+)
MLCETFLIDSTISSMAPPASATSFAPPSIRRTLEPMSPVISFADAALRCARPWTSLATAVNPRPCSPARAASTAAFSARMLVWKAMPSITPMMSPIFFELALISSMVSTTLETTAPPLLADWRAVTAMPAARRVRSLAPLSVEAICSTEAAVFCRLAAERVVRSARLALLSAIEPEFCATSLAAVDTSRTTPDSAVCMSFMACSIWLSSSRPSTWMSCVRSPLAMASAACCALRAGPTMERAM